jgi:uncharacterized protein YhhL (DUF1145 family)
MSGASGKSSGLTLRKVWLLVTNGVMLYSWASVLLNIVYYAYPLFHGSHVCEIKLVPAVQSSLRFSFLELLNSVVRATRSNPLQVLLFSVVRWGVERFVAPRMSSCNDWQHMLTIFAWSLGDTVRFGCFMLDLLLPQMGLAKAIRYTVGPIAFPIGALGEMLMVFAAASNGRPWMYPLAFLWPLGFYPLMKQLLKQRNKYFSENVQAPKLHHVKLV